jgi:hypothetical protein
MAALWQHMTFRGGWVWLLFKDLELLLELFDVTQNTEELNETI